MIRVTTFKDKTVAVFGLGASGLATVRALGAGGARVAAWDDSEAGRKAAADAGAPLVDLAVADWSEFAALVLAPGVPLTHPEPHWTVAKAKVAGVEVIGDVELFFRERRATSPKAPVVAITGTNGKSTTTALVAHLLSELGNDVQMGGNIGRAVLTLEPPAENRIHVLELSSFQIDLAPTADPTVAVLLNITPDHIDRHGTVAHYAEVKRRLVEGAQETVVIGIDDDWCADIARALEKRSGGPKVRRISVREPVADGVYSLDGTLHERSHHHEQATPIDLGGIATLRGRHNWQNAAAAVAVVEALPLASAHRVGLAGGLASFPGLPHRLELVKRWGPVEFINDSKATNADSTEKALASFAGNIYWILGGKPKAGGITTLEPYFPRIAKAYLIGEATEEFAATLGNAVPFERCGTLDFAVRRAADDALAANQENSVVLLSPACASYDQFRNFEIRGDAFKRFVADLAAERAGT
ncbi:UDP-N-acetylmuramoyl-L-alanine--D-glutamate ligase [Hyphomicrobium sp.]|uniref:UDP-N-acetylmuramoyl-L-alanine--D-glutamate ligase n=1 Tax=Hyphomicrobium sp. TaxID=82 RepID=UPI0025B9C487|nr:UDP-N-acetylmuramoyl-L-alanine--D-glutamate ligase [Hyphomicrobium sp.]MCC7252118.1 UDP-N-acetylmuramoyl-L-alanine--D-glutamate ligase [Hyphomicrobium sp.]